MAQYTRQRVDTEAERKMLIHLIVSDRVCKEVLPLVNKDYLQNPYSPIVLDWIRKYWDKYQVAPGKHIQDLFESEKNNIPGDRTEMVAGFLERLSEEYERESVINEPYLIDKCVEYLDERSLLDLSEKIQVHTVNGDKSKAKSILASYKKVALAMSPWSNPFSPEEVNLTMDAEKDVLFQMPGALGQLLGSFERGTFVVIMAPVKKGKTWFLMEIAVMALLFKLRVAFISLEMKKEKMQQRLYKRLISTAMGKGSILYPCFDCYRNQDGSCSSIERKGRGDLIESREGENIFFKHYNEKIDWTPCDVCRGRKKSDFIPADSHWYVSSERPGMDLGSVRDYIMSVRESFGNNLRLKCYPRFSANLEDIERDLDLLEYTEGFIPDVIVVDYADILRPEKNSSGEKIDQTDETWMTLAQIGDRRRALMLSATQSNREAWDAKSTKAKNVGGYYMKFAHVEMAFMLSQTPAEKKNNIIRCSVAVSRNEDFNENYQVRILQQLEAGQPLIDSEFEVF
jgi:hypothetical protein